MTEERVEVIAYSGYRGEETPRVFKWRGVEVEVSEIRSRCLNQGADDRDTKREFRVIGTDNIAYCLTYDEQTQEWFCESKKDDV